MYENIRKCGSKEDLELCATLREGSRGSTFSRGLLMKEKTQLAEMDSLPCLNAPISILSEADDASPCFDWGWWDWTGSISLRYVYKRPKFSPL